MKSVLATLTCLFFAPGSFAQSPYLSLTLKMDSAAAQHTNYSIEMKICELKNSTPVDDWYTPDTSRIPFDRLDKNDVKCGEYFGSGDSQNPFNSFRFGNQVFAWEKIIVLKISNRSSRGWWPEMYVVIPVKYRSFVTTMHFRDLVFQSGKVIFLDDIEDDREGSGLLVDRSLKQTPATGRETFFLKDIL